MSGHGAPVSSLHFLSAKLLASGAEDGSVAIWDSTRGVRVAFERSGHSARVSDLASWEGNCVSVGWDHSLRVLSPKPGSRAWFTKLKAQINAVCACKAAGSVVALGLWNSSIVLFNLSTRARAGVSCGQREGP